jgi:hypothetical protein
MPPPLPYFKVNIYPFPLPHFASIFFAYLLLIIDLNKKKGERGKGGGGEFYS